MKALYICSDLGIPVLGNKGAAVHVRAMVHAFGRAGCDVLLAAPVLNKSPWEIPAHCSARVLQISPSENIKDTILSLKACTDRYPGAGVGIASDVRRILFNEELSGKLIRQFDDHPPDFIYERVALYSTAGLDLARAIRRPLVVELNAPLVTEQTTYRGSGMNELAAAAEQRTLTGADLVLVVSDVLRQYVLERGVSPDRVLIVPNGVDPTQFFPAPPHEDRMTTRRRWSLGSGPVLGFVGGLRPWHGVEVLPQLLLDVKQALPTAQMLIVGDGPMRQVIQTEFAEKGLSADVRFTGSLCHDQVAPAIRALDVAVAPYPTLTHDFYFSPLKLFEYLACGVPVVAPNVGQIAEVVSHNENGLLYPTNDGQALSAACIHLLRDDALRTTMGRLGSARILKNYTWDKNAQQVLRRTQELSHHHQGT